MVRAASRPADRDLVVLVAFSKADQDLAASVAFWDSTNSTRLLAPAVLLTRRLTSPFDNLNFASGLPRQLRQTAFLF